ncbi:uncharacterized protein LOC135928389 isoform X2 [Gordionus sp. m RMFG-2023]|uniref:uncharacterized protein LOC135928389 isoform X2 n=1 Tax=Gordionus sp. m RMFG-2023 TaxID=3053472 RepID=UPI0031FD9EB6
MSNESDNVLNIKRLLLDKSGLPLNKTQRLPTLRIPKDFSLGRNKKVFTPNLSQAFNRKTNKEKNEIENSLFSDNPVHHTTKSNHTFQRPKKQRETFVANYDSIFAQGFNNDQMIKGRNSNFIGVFNDSPSTYKKSNKTSPSKSQNLDIKSNEDIIPKKVFEADDIESSYIHKTISSNLSSIKKEQDRDSSSVKVTSLISENSYDISHISPSYKPLSLPLKHEKGLKSDAKPRWKKNIFREPEEALDSKSHLESSLWELIDRENLFPQSEVKSEYSYDFEDKNMDYQQEDQQNLYIFNFPSILPFTLENINNNDTNITPDRKDFTSQQKTPSLQPIGKLKITENGRIFFATGDKSDSDSVLHNHNDDKNLYHDFNKRETQSTINIHNAQESSDYLFEMERYGSSNTILQLINS